VCLQTQPPPAPGHKQLYNGAIDCLRKTIAKEGLLGLYQGMGAPILAITPVTAVSFFGFGLGQKLQQAHPQETLTHSQLFRAGLLAGVFSSAILTPVERIKCLLQIQSGSQRMYTGPSDCVRKLYRHSGIPGIYKGTFLTLLRGKCVQGCPFATVWHGRATAQVRKKLQRFCRLVRHLPLPDQGHLQKVHVSIAADGKPVFTRKKHKDSGTLCNPPKKTSNAQRAKKEQVVQTAKSD
ncbi:mitochondrial carnitine/acylcarnitine carrier protein-like, partial [Hypanus sabinus]|uniref:mitochondrial carnitine/acylcarnitine carrier protein-like n=1 Tax=Hypanus sabinus TaxID=79690 RepID=UPI0028C4ACC6